MNRLQTPTVSRIVTGTDALSAALLALASRSCWLNVEPLPFGRYQITVKPEAERWLPAALTTEQWADSDCVPDQRLLEVSEQCLGQDFAEFRSGEAAVSDSPRVVQRCEDGFVVTAHVWIDYPRNEA